MVFETLAKIVWLERFICAANETEVVCSIVYAGWSCSRDAIGKTFMESDSPRVGRALAFQFEGTWFKSKLLELNFFVGRNAFQFVF